MMIKDKNSIRSIGTETAQSIKSMQESQSDEHKQLLDNEISSEEKEFLRYQLLSQNYQRQYETVLFYQYDEEDDVIIDVLPHRVQTEESKIEEAIIYNQTKDKELIKDIANLLGNYEIEQVSKVRWLLKGIIEFIGKDISKVDFMTEIVNAVKITSQKTDVLERLRNERGIDDKFIKEFIGLIKQYGEPASDF